jgi:plasmid stability protein
MRTTVDLPDELYRRAKAQAALRGRKLKDLIEEALRQVLEAPETKPPAKPAPAPSVHDLMRDCCGIAKNAPADYASNPKYMEGFGR